MISSQGEMILLDRPDWVNTVNRIAMTGKTRTPHKDICNSAVLGHLCWLPQPPKRSAILGVQCLCILGLQLAISTPIQTCSETACIWANPHLQPSLALRKTAEIHDSQV